MCAGLSGVIDTADDLIENQKSLFSAEDWNTITSHYVRFQQKFQYQVLKSQLTTVYDTWDTIYRALSVDNELFQARKLYNRVSSEISNVHTYKQLQVLDFFLDTMDTKQFILNPIDVSKLTEKDWESNIWLPLFTRLSDIKRNIGNNGIRVKTGESVPVESTRKKVSQYGDGNSVIGFKVDGRFIYDYKELEIDLASAEVSLPSADAAKLRHEESKLFREAMVSTEAILRLLENQTDVYTWSIKINGLSAEFSTLSYGGNIMIYVNTSQFEFYFPTCISDLDHLKDDLDNLFKFKEDVESIQIKVEKALKQSECQEQQSTSATVHTPCPQMDPYFTPPRNEAKRSVLPTNIRRFDLGI